VLARMPLAASDRLMPAAEVATRLGVEISTLRRWLAHGGGPVAAFTAAGELAYWNRDVEDWQDRLGARVVDEIDAQVPSAVAARVVRVVGGGPSERVEIRAARSSLGRCAAVGGARDRW
jgi:hypothetical protein